MIEINKNPTLRELRQFSGLFLLFGGILGGLVQLKGGALQTSVIIWSVAAGISVVGLAIPSFMRLVFIGMMYLAFPIGWVVSHVVLALVLYLVMTPIGWALRMTGRAMPLKPDPSKTTYWNEHNPSRSLDGYFKQF